MPAVSVGILLYRRRAGTIEVLLGHPGGPFWRRRDLGAWTIPKGKPEPGELPEATARREATEELGSLPAGTLHPLGTIRQRGGKTVMAFALEGEFDVASLASNHFDLEWPPRSGHVRSYPEIDRAAWFGLDEARQRINEGQLPLLDRLEIFCDSGDVGR